MSQKDTNSTIANFVNDCIVHQGGVPEELNIDEEINVANYYNEVFDATLKALQDTNKSWAQNDTSVVPVDKMVYVRRLINSVKLAIDGQISRESHK